VLGVDGYNPSIIQYNVPPTGAAANAGERWGVGCKIERVHAVCCRGEAVHCVGVGRLGCTLLRFG
jgi:hypothetical protein